MRHLMRADLVDLEAYTPPPAIAEIERRLGRPMVKLDTNENSYGPSPKVVEALARGRFHLYPDPDATALRESLADYLGVEVERIVPSAGGDEMLDHLMRLFLAPGDEVIDATPQFSMYPRVTAYNHGRHVRVPRDGSFAVDVEAIEGAVTSRTKVIFVCNPNNPTGNGTPREDIVRILEIGRLVVLDEAYAEFAGWTLVDLTYAFPNLVVLRTMSKWGALAGLRLGYAVVDPLVAWEFRKIKSPYNVGLAAQIAGVASLEDRAYLLCNARKIIAERKRLHDRLAALPYGRVYPSETNFLYWTTDGIPARAFRHELLERGVMVRAFHDPVEALRFSVGTPQESDILLCALEEAHAALTG